MAALEGRRAVVTGATRGIGAASARALAQAGATVAFCGRDAKALSALEAELVAWTPASFGTIADLSSAQDGDAFAAEIEQRLGGADLIVNNVGQSPSRNFLRMTDDDWRTLLELNLLAAIRLTRALLPGMRERHYGRIVMVSSLSAKFPDAALIDYAASKAALVASATALARRYGRDNVLVNSVLPGLIHTPMWDRAAEEIAAARGSDADAVLTEQAKQVPLGRYGTPDEVARVILFLLSNDASYVNGAAIDVDGGLSGHVH